MSRLWILLASLIVVEAIAQPAERCESKPPAAGYSSICGFAKPEDVEYIPARSLIVVSEQGWKAPESGGAISAVAVKDGKPGQRRQLWPPLETGTVPVSGASANRGPSRFSSDLGEQSCTTPPLEAFSPHGLATFVDDAVVRVVVVGHGAREALELFDLQGAGDDASLIWRGCIPLPPKTAGNDVSIHPDGRLFVSNYVEALRGPAMVAAHLRAARGLVTGDVIVWSRAGGWRHLVGTESSMPNGLLVRPEDSSLYVAESGRSGVLRFKLDGERVLERQEIDVAGGPDNLSLSGRGTVLAAVLSRSGSRGWQLVEIDSQHRTSVLTSGTAEKLRGTTSATDLGSGLVFGSMSEDRIIFVPR